MVGGHHQLNGHEFEQALGERQGSRKESDTVERQNNSNN